MFKWSVYFWSNVGWYTLITHLTLLTCYIYWFVVNGYVKLKLPYLAFDVQYTTTPFFTNLVYLRHLEPFFLFRDPMMSARMDASTRERTVNSTASQSPASTPLRHNYVQTVTEPHTEAGDSIECEVNICSPVPKLFAKHG